MIIHFRERQGHLSASKQDLSEAGLDVGVSSANAPTEVSLDTIPGLRYVYNAGQQSVALEVPDALRKPYRFSTRGLEPTPAASASRGVLFNYDAFAQRSNGTQLALWSEARYFDSAGVFSNTGTALLARDQDRYVRYDTSWSHSDATTLSTIQVGDTVSSSLSWTRSVRLAGLQWRSNFALRPDLITFPVPSLSGSAVVPSSVDLYINSVKQFSGSVPSGPFVVNSVPGITGAGQATVVTQDALGRTVSTTVPLYVDTRMLAAGLSSYSFEAGFLRHDYGTSSFAYNPHPAASASMRRGINDALTLEAHAEATPGLYAAGVGALVRLGMAGVLNGSVSTSAGRLAGSQVSLGYQWILPRFAIDAQSIRTFGNYGDLAARDGTPAAMATDRLTLSLPLPAAQSVSLSYIGVKVPQVAPSRIGSVAYSASVGHRMSFTLSAFRNFAQSSSNGVFLSVNIGLGRNISTNSSFGMQNGESSYNVNALRSPDYSGGWGWGVQAGDTAHTPYGQAQVQYLGRYGQVSAVAQQTGAQTNASVDVTGALVWMDHSIELSRRVYDGFALVSTDGVAGIPVMHENRMIGATDGSGHLLVPDLNAYQHNQIGIDSMNLPTDARIGVTSMDVVPQAQAGVLAHFSVTRYSAASIILHESDGKIVPVGARVHDVESGADTIVGYDGLTFVDELKPKNHLMVDHDGRRCEVTFFYSRPQGGGLPTIGPLICRALTEQTR